MTTLINDLKSAGVLTKNMVWMDIENTAYWSSSCTDNQNWLSDAISTINSLYKGCGLSTCVGIYTSSSQWSPIMCNTSSFSSHQLWYAHYDNSPSFSGMFFQSFLRLLFLLSNLFLFTIVFTINFTSNQTSAHLEDGLNPT